VSAGAETDQPRADRVCDPRTTIEPNPDGHLIEYTDFPPSHELLEPLLRELFERHWRSLVFGYCIQGAVFELEASEPPRVSLLDGYLTVDHGRGHMHLCIGEHRGSPANPTPPELAAWRRVGRAAWYRALNRERAPVSWGLRLWNGRAEQMLTVFFPNPVLRLGHAQAASGLGEARAVEPTACAPPRPAGPTRRGPETTLDPHG
jgi:hypothetical protein